MNANHVEELITTGNNLIQFYECKSFLMTYILDHYGNDDYFTDKFPRKVIFTLWHYHAYAYLYSDIAHLNQIKCNKIGR